MFLFESVGGVAMHIGVIENLLIFFFSPRASGRKKCTVCGKKRRSKKIQK
jgi:hypothetical protein